MTAYKNLEKKHKKAKIQNSIEKNIECIKQPHAKHNPDAYDSMTPGWSFRRIAKENRWSLVPEELIQTDNECLSEKCLLSLLISYETMTWIEIKSKTHDDGLSSNHYIDENLDKLSKKARKRLDELKLYENVFSLSLGNKKRIYGVLQSNVLEILWYDNNHEIYPINYGNKKR